MTAQDVTEPVSRGAFVGAIVRISAISLGTASAVLLSHSAFGVRFNEEFVRFLNIVQDAIGFLVTPVELLFVGPLTRWLHDHGFAFQLYRHWHHAFVLLWLWNVSELRTHAPRSLLFGQEGTRAAIVTALRWVWAAAAALGGGTLAGTVPLNDSAVLWWPITAFFLRSYGDSLICSLDPRFDEPDIEEKQYVSFTIFLATAYGLAFAGLALGWVNPPALLGKPPLFWLPLAAYLFQPLMSAFFVRPAGASLNVGVALLELALFIVTGALALGVLHGPGWLDFSLSPSSGLANLAAFVLVVAIVDLFFDVLVPEEGRGGYIARILRDIGFQSSLDVLAVLGSTAIIVYLAHQLA